MCVGSFAPGESGGTPTGDAGGGPSAGTMGSIATGLQVLGVFDSTQGAYKKSQGEKLAYETQAAVSRNAAQVDEWRAHDALQRGEQDAFKAGLRKAQVTGAQRARMGASSSLDEGSPLAILQDTEFMGNVDMATIGDNAAREAWVLRNSAANSRTNADLYSYRARSENPGRSAASTFLSGAGAVASNWYRMRRAGADV